MVHEFTDIDKAVYNYLARLAEEAGPDEYGNYVARATNIDISMMVHPVRGSVPQAIQRLEKAGLIYREIINYSTRYIHIDPLKKIGDPSPHWGNKANREELPLVTRYRVLVRDNSTCVLCGNTPSLGAVIHVDHILPRSFGGSNDMDNLRCLCSECNVGKGNSLLEAHDAR